MRLLAAAGLLAVTTAAASADDPKKLDLTAGTLAGTWKLVKSDQGTPEGLTFFVEFTKDGAMTIRAEAKGEKQLEMKGTFTAKGDKIDYTVKQPDGEKKQEVLTVKKYTADELVVEDPAGVKETFARVKPEKKKEK
jgi:uncharacterized protein (TIGR03066 family)